MTRSFTRIALLFLSIYAFPSAGADVVHKWVDAQGVTHYSDKPPTASATPVYQIDLPAYYSVVDAQSDYYSIENQWRRLREERIVRDRLRLELAKTQASQQPPPPQVILGDDPQVRQSYAPYPWFWRPYHRHHHSGYPWRIEQHRGHAPRGRMEKVHPNGMQQRGGRLIGIR